MNKNSEKRSAEKYFKLLESSSNRLKRSGENHIATSSIECLQAGIGVCLGEIAQRVEALKLRVAAIALLPEPQDQWKGAYAKAKAEILGAWQFVHGQAEVWQVESPARIAEALEQDTDVFRLLGIEPVPTEPADEQTPCHGGSECP